LNNDEGKIKPMTKLFVELKNRQEGQTLPEYGLMLFFMALAAVAALTWLSSRLPAMLSKVVGTLS
jgi:Flp pilus assembly pilin Flp